MKDENGSSRIFVSFFKIGLFTVGGGYAMLPLIRAEVVVKKRWMTDKDFVDMLGLAQSVPGPVALNTAVFVGKTAGGFRGVNAAVSGIVLPSFLIILMIAVAFSDFKGSSGVEAVFKGIRPAVVALIAAPLWSLGKTAGLRWMGVGIAVAVAAAVVFLECSPVYGILLAVSGGVFRGLGLKRIK